MTPALPSDTLNQQLRLLTVGLALGTACLYTYGLSYHQGSLAYWGLEETMFPLSLERSLFQGFVAASRLGAVALAPLLGLALAVFGGLLLAQALGAQARRWLERRREPGAGALPGDPAPPFWLHHAARWVQASGWALVVFLLLMLTLSVAQTLGRADAKARHQALQRGTQAPVSLTHRVRGPLVGHALICSDSHCAYLVGGSVLTLARAELTTIESRIAGAPP